MPHARPSRDSWSFSSPMTSDLRTGLSLLPSHSPTASPAPEHLGMGGHGVWLSPGASVTDHAGFLLMRHIQTCHQPRRDDLMLGRRNVVRV